MQARASSPAVVALTAAFGPEGVAGAGLGRKRKREATDIVEVSLESRYVSALGDSRFKLVPLLGPGQSHHFSAQVCFAVCFHRLAWFTAGLLVGCVLPACLLACLLAYDM